MPDCAIAEAKCAGATNIPERLRRYLQAYWLRPENALWMTLRSCALGPFPLKPPCVDLSCGDGIFSFLHAGGILHPAFDVFTCVQDSGDGANDMFNWVDANYQPEVVSPPACSCDVGTDWKSALLSKARRLGFYRHLERADHNERLPFEDDSFETSYCNAAYWVEKIDEFLLELRRITRPGGRVILQVKLDVMRECTLDRHRHVLGKRFLEIIDRGRMASWPTLADRATWEHRFRRAGLVVLKAIPFVSATHAHLWDIGLRPVAPMLVRMTSAIGASTRGAIKKDWVALFHELLLPFCDPEFTFEFQAREPVELQYVLSPDCK